MTATDALSRGNGVPLTREERLLLNTVGRHVDGVSAELRQEMQALTTHLENKLLGLVAPAPVNNHIVPAPVNVDLGPVVDTLNSLSQFMAQLTASQTPISNQVDVAAPNVVNEVSVPPSDVHVDMAPMVDAVERMLGACSRAMNAMARAVNDLRDAMQGQSDALVQMAKAVSDNPPRISFRPKLTLAAPVAPDASTPPTDGLDLPAQPPPPKPRRSFVVTRPSGDDGPTVIEERWDS